MIRRSQEHVFHLAIPCADLKETHAFYEKLGCVIHRSYEDRITLNFFGDQIVCHLAPEKIDQTPTMYPRHFGLTFYSEAAFAQLYSAAKDSQLKFFKDLFVRFQGRPEEHQTFFLIDPSNNILEFKHYLNPEMVY